MDKPQTPWIPGPDEIDQFRKDMKVALSSDFRKLLEQTIKEDERSQS